MMNNNDSLFNLTVGQQNATWKALEEAGCTPELLKKIRSQSDFASSVVQYAQAGAPSVLLPGPSYDASGILGFGQPMQGELPQAEPGDVVIWYGGWSLQQLRDNEVVHEKNLIWVQDWYNEYDWSTEALPVGFYTLRIPVPNSNNKTFDEQTELLIDCEQVAHPVLVATADLCHEIQTCTSLLGRMYVRTDKKNRDGHRVGLTRHGGRLRVDYWDDSRSDDTYLTSARDCT